jgi:sigma-B regulation protein RsbU (phosphoserine phosphatase)
MVYGVVNVDTGKLNLSRAGHPFPIVVGAQGSIDSWEAPGKMLGVFETEFQTESKQLAPGDKLLLSTDGAFPDRGADEKWEKTELFQAIKIRASAPVTEFVSQLAEQFVGDRKLEDDATLIALEFLA